MAYALAPQIYARPWSFGVVNICRSRRYLCSSLNFTKIQSDFRYSSVGKLTRATGDPSFRSVEEGVEEKEEFQVLTATTSYYNDIVIVDTPQSRMLLLDSSSTTFRFSLIFNFYPLKGNSDLLNCAAIVDADNVHSILYKEQIWTGSYWVSKLALFYSLTNTDAPT